MVATIVEAQGDIDGLNIMIVAILLVFDQKPRNAEQISYIGF